jgi:hypothetical protein
MVGIQDLDSGMFSPLSWGSKKLRRVVHSSLAAETEATVDAISNAVVLAEIWDSLFAEEEGPIHRVLFTDCKSMWDHLNNKGGKLTEKRLIIPISSIREDLQNGVINSMQWCMTEDQLADSLTKRMTPVELLHTLQTGRLRLREGISMRSQGLEKKERSVEMSDPGRPHSFCVSLVVQEGGLTIPHESHGL